MMGPVIRGNNGRLTSKLGKYWWLTSSLSSLCGRLTSPGLDQCTRYPTKKFGYCSMGQAERWTKCTRECWTANRPSWSRRLQRFRRLRLPLQLPVRHRRRSLKPPQNLHQPLCQALLLLWSMVQSLNCSPARKVILSLPDPRLRQNLSFHHLHPELLSEAAHPFIHRVTALRHLILLPIINPRLPTLTLHH